MIFDGHSDIFSDVRYKREAGETQVLKNRHLERLQKGGIGGGCFVIWVDTFNGEDPQKELDAIIKNMKDEMAETEDFVLVHNTAEIEAARSVFCWGWKVLLVLAKRLIASMNCMISAADMPC